MAKISKEQFRALFKSYEHLENQDSGIDTLYPLIDDAVWDDSQAWFQDFINSNSGELKDTEQWDRPLWLPSQVADALGLDEANISAVITNDLPRVARLFGLNSGQQAVILSLTKIWGQSLTAHLAIGDNSALDLERFTGFLVANGEAPVTATYTTVETNSNFPLTATAYALSCSRDMTACFVKAIREAQTKERLTYCFYLIPQLVSEDQIEALVEEVHTDVLNLMSNLGY